MRGLLLVAAILSQALGAPSGLLVLPSLVLGDAVPIKPLKCYPGHFVPWRLSVCTPCAPGTFQPSPESSVHACTPCPPGKFQQNAGFANCDLCAPGRFNDLGGKRFCASCTPPFSSARGAAKCSACKAGRFGMRPAGPLSAPLCTACKAGRYQFAGLFACHKCAAGTFSKAGATFCTQCAAGTAAPREGQTACAKCRTGRFSATTAAKACVLCPHGRFSKRYGATKCALCRAGRYGLKGAGSPNCTGKCAPGRFGRPGARDDRCSGTCSPGYYGRGGSTTHKCDGPCQPGRYSSASGAASCTACAAGRYQWATAKTKCHACPHGKYSTYAYTGHGSCKMCSRGRLSNRGADFCRAGSGTGAPTPSPTPPTPAPTPLPTVSPSWTPPPTPQLRAACNTVVMGGQVPGQPGADCMGKYRLQSARVMGLPIYRFDNPEGRYCGTSRTVFLYFNAMAHMWVVGPHVGVPPFVLSAAGTSNEYLPYNVSAVWNAAIGGGDARAPVPWIHVKCEHSDGDGTTAIHPEKPPPVNSPAHAPPPRPAVRLPRHEVRRRRAVVLKPVMTVHASMALVSASVGKAAFRSAVAGALDLLPRDVRIDSWHGDVAPVTAEFRVIISSARCQRYTVAHCDPRTGRLDLVTHVLEKPAFTKAVVMGLHQYDKGIVQSDFRIAGVRLTRSRAFLDQLAGELAQQTRESKWASRSSSSQLGTPTKPKHPYRSPPAPAAPAHVGWTSTQLLELAGACLGTLWATAVASIMRDRRQAEQRQADSYAAHLRAQYDFNADGRPSPSLRSASGGGGGVALGGAPLAADWSTMGGGTGSAV